MAIFHGKAQKNHSAIQARWRGYRTAGNSAPSSSDYYYNIGTWNVRGLLKQEKRANVVQEMDRVDVDILGLSETHWKDVGNSRPAYQQYQDSMASSIQEESKADKVWHSL
eukprot:gene9104-16760_t